MTKTYRACLSELPFMLSFVREEASKRNFSSEDLNQIEIAIEEALVNIIQHGYLNDSGHIAIECAPYRESGLEITLTDNGIPYNPLSNLPNFNLEAQLDERIIGGYGVFLINKFMTEVNYKREGNKNILSLIKSF